MPPNVSFAALVLLISRVIQKLISGVENWPPEARVCQNGVEAVLAMVSKARPMIPAFEPSKRSELV